jgi:hypothetical protein
MRDSNGIVLYLENIVEVNGRIGHIVEFLEDYITVKFDDNGEIDDFEPNQLTIIK